MWTLSLQRVGWVTVIALFLVGVQCGGSMTEDDVAPDEAANAMLEVILADKSSRSTHTLVWQSGEGEEEPKIRKSFRQYFVQLDDIRRFEQGNHFEGLLRSSKRWVYPVSFPDGTHVTLTVAKSNGRWEVARFGEPAHAATLLELSQRQDVGEADLFEVQILGLGRTFLAWRDSEGVWLIPVRNDPALDLVRGEKYKGEEVLERLGSLAKEHKGLPG